MISFANKVLNDTVFRILIVVITFLMQIHFIHLMYGGYVKYVLAFGLLVCGWQLFNKTFLQKSYTIYNITAENKLNIKRFYLFEGKREKYFL